MVRESLSLHFSFFPCKSFEDFFLLEFYFSNKGKSLLTNIQNLFYLMKGGKEEMPTCHSNIFSL